MRRWWMTAVGAAMVAACQTAETAEQMDARIEAESQAARTAIEAANARFVAHFNAGHADSAAMNYLTDGRVMQPNGPTVVGRDSIQALLAQWMSWGTWNLALHIQAVVANGPIAIERGHFVISFQPGANAPMPAMSDSGKYLVHWHQHDGAWLIADDIWNSDVPLPPPPPARRR